MRGKLFPRFNLLLIDGQTLFEEAFTCFLEQVYVLSLYNKTLDNLIEIKISNEIKTILSRCLSLTTEKYAKEAKTFIKTKNVFCNIVIYFNLVNVNEKQEIFDYLDKSVIYNHINKNIKLFNKKHINFYLDKESSSIQFLVDEITTINEPSGKIKETLNIINFNLS